LNIGRPPRFFLGCAASLIVALVFESHAAADVSVSTNAGWSPYLLEQALTPPEKEASFLQSATISGSHIAALTQTGFTTSEIGVVHLDEFSEANGWAESTHADVGIGTVIGYDDRTWCYSIASDGDNVIVSQPTFSIIPSYYGQGAAMFFRHTAQGWAFSGFLIDPDPSEGQFFGCKVAISGNIAVVGMPYGGEGGLVFTANFDGQQWTLGQKLHAPPGVSCFGCAVAISGDRIVVGAPNQYNLAGGTAYVYSQLNGVWRQTAQLTASAPEIGDEFARSVAIDGETIAIGANRKNLGAGAVYIYRSVGLGWELQTELQQTPLPGHERAFGFAMALRAGRLVIGEPGMSAAHLFQERDGTWTSRATFASDDLDAKFGWIVGISGREIVTGAPSSSGTIYVFRDDQIFADDFH